MMVAVSASLFFSLFSLSPVPLTRVTSAEKLLCLLCETISKVSCLIIILRIFLQKGECFDWNNSLGCVYPSLVYTLIYTSLDFLVNIIISSC